MRVSSCRSVQISASAAFGFVAGSTRSNNPGQEPQLPENTGNGSEPLLENRSANEGERQVYGAALVQVETDPKAGLPLAHSARGGTTAEPLLSAVEAAKQLGVCPHSIYTLCESGKLRFVRVMNAIRIARADLEMFRSTRDMLGLGLTPSGVARRRKRR